MKAIDETWYKRAVDQYAVEPDSFVYSVPFDVGASGNPLVTATHAVFIEHKGHRAPAAVVGLQYQHSTLSAHFINITSAVTSASLNDLQNVNVTFFSVPVHPLAARPAPAWNLTATF